MALGILVKDSCFDKDEMALKLQELQLDIDVENILNIIVKLIDTFYEDKEFEEIFEDNIKLNAFSDASIIFFPFTYFIYIIPF